MYLSRRRCFSVTFRTVADTLRKIEGVASRKEKLSIFTATLNDIDKTDVKDYVKLSMNQFAPRSDLDFEVNIAD
jgi:hypothetical protein